MENVSSREQNDALSPFFFANVHIWQHFSFDIWRGDEQYLLHILKILMNWELFLKVPYYEKFTSQMFPNSNMCL